MAVYQLFGLDSGWHHLTNVLFHMLASALLLAALHRMTRALWPSAFVAFRCSRCIRCTWSRGGLGQRRRKDVLCAFFWCLTMRCYARYVERPIGGRRYGLVVLAFVGGAGCRSR